MGRATRKRQEELAAKDQIIADALKNRPKKKAEKEPLIVLPAHLFRFRDRQLRRANQWKYLGKSRDIEKQRISFIRHTYGKYRVPTFLERAFISEDENLRNRYGSWYIAAAQGDSLYKTCTRGLLSKKESHYLLQAPDELNVKQAIWWAKSMAVEDNVGVAYRTARSAIPRRADYTQKFWNDVHRFFVLNPVPITEMNDLMDFICAMRLENENWSITKRSLAAVRRQSEKWHRDMIKLKSIGGGKWDGMDVPPWKASTGKFDYDPNKDTKTTWRVFEILSGDELAREGNRMRHCVSSYKSRCMSGDTAIFAMRSDTAKRQDRRHLTMEVLVRSRTVVQARGLANRHPTPQEKTVMETWANHNKLICRVRQGWY